MQDNIKSTYRFVGNIYNEKLHDGYAGAVFLPWGGVSPALTTMQGGNRQPHIIINSKNNEICKRRNNERKI